MFYTITYRLPKKTTRILPHDYEITERTPVHVLRKYILDLNRDLGDIELVFNDVVLDEYLSLGETPVPKYCAEILTLVVRQR